MSCILPVITDLYLSKGNQESDEKYVKDFSVHVEAAIKSILCAIQKLVEKSEEEKTLEHVKTEEEGKNCGHSFLCPSAKIC